jgi:hypothetical protein
MNVNKIETFVQESRPAEAEYAPSRARSCVGVTTANASPGNGSVGWPTAGGRSGATPRLRGPHAESAADLVVTDHPLFRALGADAAERQIAYRELFRELLDEVWTAELRAAATEPDEELPHLGLL